MILLTNYRLNKPHQKKTKHTSISSCWLCKTTSTQKTTLSITDLYSKKKKTTPNIEDFHRELKEAAAMCRFTDRNAEIKSQLIMGCLSEKVRQKGLMNPNMLLGDLINYAKMTETISKQMEQMRLEDTNSTTKPTTSINAVANKVTHEQQWPRKHPQQNQCRNCNGKYPHERGPTSCPAFQNQCAYCRRWGHFASVCFRKLNDEDRRRRTNHPPRPQAQTSQRPVNYIEDHQRDSNSSSDTEYVFHTGKVKNLSYFDLSFGDGHQMFNVLADSGATINILSEADYKSLRPTPLLRPTKTVISGFGVKEATPLLGQFSTLLKFRGISCQADIHVIKNPEKPIIGWETCKRLKLLSANTHSVNHISNSDAQTPLPILKLLEDYADLFNGLGKLKEKSSPTHRWKHTTHCSEIQQGPLSRKEGYRRVNSQRWETGSDWKGRQTNPMGISYCCSTQKGSK